MHWCILRNGRSTHREFFVTAFLWILQVTGKIFSYLKDSDIVITLLRSRNPAGTMSQREDKCQIPWLKSAGDHRKWNYGEFSLVLFYMWNVDVCYICTHTCIHVYYSTLLEPTSRTARRRGNDIFIILVYSPVIMGAVMCTQRPEIS